MQKRLALQRLLRRKGTGTRAKGTDVGGGGEIYVLEWPFSHLPFPLPFSTRSQLLLNCSKIYLSSVTELKVSKFLYRKASHLKQNF